jgi:hypothetical protein
MVPHRNSTLGYGTAGILSTAALVALTGCYSRAQHPGLVRVTDYADGQIVVVELEELRVDFDDEIHVWVVATVTEEDSRCTPVTVSFLGTDGESLALESAEFSSGAGVSSGARLDGTWAFDARELTVALIVEPVWLELSTGSTALHNELVFNLRQFVAQVDCRDGEREAQR